jgi:hypothetical protein
LTFKQQSWQYLLKISNFACIPLSELDNKIMSSRGCSGSQKVGARKIARCHFQVPVLKVRSQFRSQIKILQSFCFWWWNRNEKQKYNTDINICTNKSEPFIHETEHETGNGTCNYPVSVGKNWLLVKILAGSWLSKLAPEKLCLIS